MAAEDERGGRRGALWGKEKQRAASPSPFRRSGLEHPPRCLTEAFCGVLTQPAPLGVLDPQGLDEGRGTHLFQVKPGSP